MDWLDLLQWPAMLVTVCATWFMASRHKQRRAHAFWLFLASNALWLAWGLHTSAWGLVLLQLCLALMNLRGAAKVGDES